MQTTKTFSALLIWIAENSPPAYAVTIRERNQTLLANLKQIEPYLGCTFSQVPEAVFCAYAAEVPIGCPHCPGICFGAGDDHDMRCLWAQAAKKFACPGPDSNAVGEGTKMWSGGLPCCDAVFPTQSLGYGSVSGCDSIPGFYRSLGISYGHSHAYLRMGGYGGNGYTSGRWKLDEVSVVKREDYERVQAFLQDHVDWAQLPCWGSKYVPPALALSVPATT